MEYSSQLLSNFKLFSKPDEKTLSFAAYSIPKQYLILTMIIIVGFGVIYYLQDDIKRSLDAWILAMHLTSQGEWMSTYVPEKFSLTTMFDRGVK